MSSFVETGNSKLKLGNGKLKQRRRLGFFSGIICVIFLLFTIDVYAQDITAQYQLPPLERAPKGSKAKKILKRAKVLRYAEEMPVKFTEVMDTGRYIQELKASIMKQVKKTEGEHNILYFNGKTAGELNRFMKNTGASDQTEIILTKMKIILNEPINLKSHIIIRGSSTHLVSNNINIAIIGKDINNAGLKDLIIEEPLECGIMLINTAGLVIDNITIANGRNRGMVIRGGSRFVHINHSKFVENQSGGIMIQEGSHHVCVTNCEISDGHSSSNWSAGVVITQLLPVSEYGIMDEFDSNYFFPKDLSFKKEGMPFKNIIETSYIHDNQSSGIYIDRGNGNVLMGNNIVDNDKEGLCIDFFSVGNIVESNIITGNGFRKFQSDDDLRHDFVLHFGRLADGSAVSKLPNISLDNAAYNIIARNAISNAAGDGIKIVRSGFRNIFCLNSITDNNRGENSVFFFSGVLLGSAGSDVENDMSGIDAFPSIENIVFGNTIYGAHKAGVCIDKGSVYNDIYDNMIMKQKGKYVIKNGDPNNITGNNFNVITKKLVVFFIMIVLAGLVLSVFSGIVSFLLIKRYFKKN